MTRTASRLLSLVPLFIHLTACGPIIPIPPGTPTSSLVLSATTPGTNFEQFILDGRSYRAPMLSFLIPSGEHSVGVRYAIRLTDPCDPEESFCTSTVMTGACSGSFRAETDGDYRLLLDTRSGGPVATIRRRSGGSFYVGQGEGVESTLTCDINETRSREAAVGIATF